MPVLTATHQLTSSRATSTSTTPTRPSFGRAVAITIYTDAALNRLRQEGFKVLDDDVARLSPLGHDHINMLGRYAFTLPARVARGELRPLRDPNLQVDEAV